MDGKGLPRLNKRTKEGFCSVGDSDNHWMLPPGKGVYYRENQKNHQKLQHLLKARLILLANTATSGQYTNSWPCPVSLRVITRRPVALCSWPIFKAVTTSRSCNKISNHQTRVALLILYPKLIWQWSEHWTDCFTYLQLTLKRILCIRPCFHL